MRNEELFNLSSSTNTVFIQEYDIIFLFFKGDLLHKIIYSVYKNAL